MESSVLFLLVVGSLHTAAAIHANGNVSPNAETTSDMGVVFTLFNRIFPNGMRVAPNDSEWALKFAFISDIDVKFITHGWLESDKNFSVVTIRKAYETTSNYNLISVDWSSVSKWEFVILTFKVPALGKVIGNMINRLLSLELTTLDQVHLIGHSLGCHVMGTAGGHVRDSGYGKIARITGLDPAGPGYENLRPRENRLDDTDAQFVDAIHTSIGILGYREPIGHADFYPNGGLNHQPGCTFSFDIFCSHHRSYEYFVESIYNEDAFPATKCNSYAKFQANACRHGEVVYMGDPTPPSARGTYFLKTKYRVNNKKGFIFT